MNLFKKLRSLFRRKPKPSESSEYLDKVIRDLDEAFKKWKENL